MSNPNMNMRDPVIYIIIIVPKDRWKIYPMYDYAHPIEDEGITLPSSLKIMI